MGDFFSVFSRAFVSPLPNLLNDGSKRIVFFFSSNLCLLKDPWSFSFKKEFNFRFVLLMLDMTICAGILSGHKILTCIEFLVMVEKVDLHYAIFL